MLVTALLLLAALGAFLVKAKFKNVLNRRDLPQRLAQDIQQEAKEFTFVHAYGAHSQFKIHAFREVQLKDNRIQLHGVEIDLYGEDGARVDEISGDTFDYDQKSHLAIAEGPVDMVLTRPAPAPRAGGSVKTPNASRPSPQIHLKTSGLTFDQDTGLVATAKQVDFTMPQGSGSAVGAVYDSQSGHLTLEHSVALTTHRGPEPVTVQAQHAEFDRDAQLCVLTSARVTYRNGNAVAALAKVLFRDDGTAQQLDATGGFTAQTAGGGRLAAPVAQIVFNQHSQPLHGRLEGGVTMDSARPGSATHGTSPVAELEFAPQGQLRQATLERGVQFRSEASTSSNADALHVTRTWSSPTAQLSFQDTGNGQLELRSVHGTGGVSVTSQTQGSAAAAAPSRMTADEITGTFTKGSVLDELVGTGHAAFAKTTATGMHQTATGDRLEAKFAEGKNQGLAGPPNQPSARTTNSAGEAAFTASATARAARATELQSAQLDGHITLFEQPIAKQGAQPRPPILATAGEAVYEESGQWLRLTNNPSVKSGGIAMTAQKVDVSQESGDAFARGNVKATWMNTRARGSGDATDSGDSGAGVSAPALGGSGPAHVIATDAELNESTGEVTFRGHVRLWQQANSVSAPVIVLNQHLQTLAAQTSNLAEPVQAIMLSAGASTASLRLPSSHANSPKGSSTSSPSVIRVTGGDLRYSDPERRAVMRSGVLGAVVADTGTARTSSDQVELRLMPAANQDGNPGGQAQVDRMTAAGHVVLTSQSRSGTGEQLAYSSVTGEYVLTGTPAAPPKLIDPQRGTVTGEALIFHSRDDSVSIEGGGRETMTQTTAPKLHVK